MKKSRPIMICVVTVLLLSAPSALRADVTFIAVLDNGKPALRLQSGRYEVRYIRQVDFEGEVGISFPVMHLHRNNRAKCYGDLILTPTKIAYVSVNQSDDSWTMPRAEITEAPVEWGDQMGWHIEMKLAKGGTKNFDAACYKDGKKLEHCNIIYQDLYEKAFKSSDAALVEFRQRTAELQHVQSQTAAATDDPKKQLYERFFNSRKSDPDSAYGTAMEYIRKYPDDTDENAIYIRKWVAAYERVVTKKPATNQP